ncbi:aconitate hydratase 1, partial [Bordetella holmesii H620]
MSCWSRCCATVMARRSQKSTSASWPTGNRTPSVRTRFRSWSLAWFCRTLP